MGRNQRSSRDKQLETDIDVTGDRYEDGDLEYYEDGEIASWKDVGYYCLYRAKTKFFRVSLHFVLFFLSLYTFLCGLVLLGASAQALGGCNARVIIDMSANPVSTVVAGVLVSSIFQSSIATNILIASFIGNGLSVENGVLMAMGANVGNSVVSTIIAVAHIADTVLLERAVAGASINDIYYFLALLVFVPLEIGTHMFSRIGGALVPENLMGGGFRWDGLTKIIIHPLTDLLIIPNHELFQNIASGDIENCAASYPVRCTDEIVSFGTCTPGIITCASETGRCPAFFKDGASLRRDNTFCSIAIIIAVSAILIGLFGMIKLINKMLIKTPIEVIAKMSNHHSLVSMFMGFAGGLVWASPSITESILIPFVATGIIELEQMFPWCLGANMGVALTNVSIAWFLRMDKHLHIAIASLFFNLFGTIVWYPIPTLRQFPLHGALIVGIVTRNWRIVSVLFLALTFIATPLTIWGTSFLFQTQKKNSVIAGGVITGLLTLFLVYCAYSWFFNSGRDKFIAYFENPGGKGDNYNDEMSYDDSFYEQDEDTDKSDDVSTIGFEEPRLQQTRTKTRTLSKMRPKQTVRPSARRRLIKNVGVSREENCCCNDPNFLTV